MILLLFYTLTLLSLTSAHGIPIATLYQFPKGSWLENLAAGPHGTILATRFDIPVLYQFAVPKVMNPLTHTLTPEAIPIQTFPRATGAVGITEYKHNHFLVLAGNYSIPEGKNVPGSYAVWEMRFSEYNGSHVDTRKVTDLPEVGLPNGMTTVSHSLNTTHTDTERDTARLVLFGDTVAGCVYSLHPQTGTYHLIHNDTTMHPPPGKGIGINGIHTITINKETFLYYTNTAKETFNRVRIDPVTGRATGPYTTLTTNLLGDDFAYDPRSGDFYIAGNVDNVVKRVSRLGVKEEVIGSVNQTILAGATSALVAKDGRTLYVTTNGGLLGPVNGTVVEGASLVAIDLSGEKH